MAGLLKMDKTSPLDQPEVVAALRELLQLHKHTLQIVAWSDEPHADQAPQQVGELMLYPEDFAPHQARLTVRKMGRFMDQYKRQPLVKKMKTIDEYMRQPRPGTRARLNGDQLRQRAPTGASVQVVVDDD